jgi:uncharacterized membrane protein YcaP (DUF421 family)
MSVGFLPDIFTVFIKSVISIAALFFITKLSGKKHVAQITFFDYILGIAIGSIAGTLSVDKNINYASGLTALFTWGLIAYSVAYISMKSKHARRFLDSTPTVFIRNGKIIEKNLQKEKININDLLEELRIKSVFNIADVEFAIMETDGEISVQLKSQKRPLTPEDINLPTTYQGLSTNLIIDGSILMENLQHVSLDEKWLMSELAKRSIYSQKDVLLASLDSKGELYISMKGDMGEHVTNEADKQI